MSEKKCCINCNINTRKFLIPFFLPLACTCIHFFQGILFKESKEELKLLKYNFPLLFYYFLPKIFTIIFIPLFKSFTKGESINDEQNTAMRIYHFKKIESENKKKIYFIIFLISFLEVIYKIDDSLLIYIEKTDQEENGILIEKRTGFIIFVPLFSYFILNKQLFRHHYLALFLALIGAFIINGCRFPLGFSSFEDHQFIYHIINILFSSVFSLSLVLIKYSMNKYFVSFMSVTMFLFYDGIFCIVNLLILTLFEYLPVIFIEKKIDKKENVNFIDFLNFNYLGIFKIFKEQSWKFLLFFFLTLIASFFYFVLNVLTIYCFSPYLNVLTDFITPFLTLILTYFFLTEPKEKTEELRKRVIIETIGYIILFFGALILNEIIVLNCLGLNIDTYKEISNRGIIDSYIEELGPNVNNDDNNSEGENELESNSNRSEKISN